MFFPISIANRIDPNIVQIGAAFGFSVYLHE